MNCKMIRIIQLVNFSKSRFYPNFHITPHNGFSSLPTNNVKVNPTQGSEKLILSLEDRYKMIQERSYNYISEQIYKLGDPTPNKWHELRNAAQNADLNINNFNFTGLVLKCLLNENMFDKANSFFSFIEELDKKETLLVQSYKMALVACIKQHNQESKILELYEKVKCEDAVYDTITLENIIHGLSVTKKWQEGLELIKDSIAKVSPDTYYFIAIAAFNNGNFGTGLNLISDMVKNHCPVSSEVYTAFLKNIRQSHRKSSSLGHHYFDKFFDALKSNKLIVPETIASEIKTLFNTLDVSRWQASSAVIDRDSYCPNCKRTLKPASLTPAQFKRLQNAVFKDIIEGNDVFYNTTPQEVKSYKAFIKSVMPYDVVLDGLNISFINNTRKPRDRMEKILELATYFAKERRMKVVILGRKHMLRYSTSVMKRIKSIAHVYLCQNISKDDPFLLYAALASGPNTYIVSRDLLRNHRTSLSDPEMQKFFCMWQATRQIYPFPMLGVNIEFPPQHEICVQGSLEDKDGLHIPYETVQIKDGYEIIRTWICLQTPSSMQK